VNVYTVHEPPDPPSDRIDRAERLVLVADGFDRVAAVFAPIALLRRRLWLATALYVVTVLGAVTALDALDAHPVWTLATIVAIHAVVGFECAELYRRKLAAAGWTTLGTVSGRSIDECERRFLDDWLPRQPAIGTPPATPTPRAAGGSFLGRLRLARRTG
jgi:hypothetical protein